MGSPAWARSGLGPACRARLRVGPAWRGGSGGSGRAPPVTRSQRLGSDFQRQGGQMSGQQIKERSPRLSLGRPLKLGSFFHLLFPPFPPPNDPCFLSCPIYFAPAWPQRSRVGSVCPWRDPSRGHWRRLVRRPRLCPPPGTPAPRARWPQMSASPRSKAELIAAVRLGFHWIANLTHARKSLLVLGVLQPPPPAERPGAGS